MINKKLLQLPTTDILISVVNYNTTTYFIENNNNYIITQSCNMNVSFKTMYDNLEKTYESKNNTEFKKQFDEFINILFGNNCENTKIIT
ncbi:MAG: hypothetical protein IJ848_00020 [Alphaproteobacteria bacterium]|nr:hypothetical protein [Alphaproteobacteria bacterium]